VDARKASGASFPAARTLCLLPVCRTEGAMLAARMVADFPALAEALERHGG